MQHNSAKEENTDYSLSPFMKLKIIGHPGSCQPVIQREKNFYCCLDYNIANPSSCVAVFLIYITKLNGKIYHLSMRIPPVSFRLKLDPNYET